jgi:hypothetical protein
VTTKIYSSVEDRQCYDADPDPNFHFEVDPDADPGWYQTDADPHADPTPCFTHVGKSEIFLFTSTAAPVHTCLAFSSTS